MPIKRSLLRVRWLRLSLIHIFYTQIDLDQPKAYAYAKEFMSMNSLAADAQEGMTAFLEKRPPCWAGR